MQFPKRFHHFFFSCPHLYRFPLAPALGAGWLIFVLISGRLDGPAGWTGPTFISTLIPQTGIKRFVCGLADLNLEPSQLFNLSFFFPFLLCLLNCITSFITQSIHP